MNGLVNSPFNPLSANPTKWSNTLKQFVGNLPTNYLSVFDHFVTLALKWLKMPEVISLLNACLEKVIPWLWGYIVLYLSLGPRPSLARKMWIATLYFERVLMQIEKVDQI